jgi:glutathione peroxidase-family protein
VLSRSPRRPAALGSDPRAEGNFAKYVISKDGQVAAFFPSNVTPDDPALRAAIQKALTQ